MAFYQLTKTQKLPSGIEEIWDFISAPRNLKEITPDDMGFIVTSNKRNKKIFCKFFIKLYFIVVVFIF